jgi:methyl-accepting chemotaxis protein
MASVLTQPLSTSVGLAAALAEARANTAAVIEVIGAVGRDTTNATVVQSALHAVKTAFGYDYGACWMIDKGAQHTTFAAETHSLGPAFDRVNRETHYVKGQGLTGKTWAAADTLYIPGLAAIPNSDLVRAACAAGAVSAVAFPFIVEEEVHGVLFFFSFRPISPSEDRLSVLRNIGRLVGQAFSRLLDLERETRERAALRGNAELVLASVEAAQRGDLTLDIPVVGHDAVAQVARGLGEFFANLRLSIRSIMQNANQLTKASEGLSCLSLQMLAHSGETSQSAAAATLASKEVSANIEGIAAGSAQMRASMMEIAKRANNAASDIHSAVDTASATRSAIAKLAASSKDIGAMVKIIESIAKQTRLLALNASIEAARAGAAGLGFTVVANEVKELAKGTSKATDQIGDKIAAIQADTSNAVQSITDIGNVFEKVSQTSSKIAETVEEQSSTTHEIGENVTQAAAGSSSISDKISAVAAIAQQAQQQASQTQSAAKELASMALELHGLVSRFKVD